VFLGRDKVGIRAPVVGPNSCRHRMKIDSC
jgi:hypothetical protein